MSRAVLGALGASAGLEREEGGMREAQSYCVCFFFFGTVVRLTWNVWRWVSQVERIVRTHLCVLCVLCASCVNHQVRQGGCVEIFAPVV